MVTRRFSNPKWDDGRVVEWRGANELWTVTPKEKDRSWGEGSFTTPAEALNRCLDAVARGNWYEILPHESSNSRNTPNSDIVPW